MTPEELADLQRMVALRMSVQTGPGPDWPAWTDRLQKRVRVIEMWTQDGTRPTFQSALMLAADAMTLLHHVDQAEMADPSTGAPDV